MSIVQKLLVVVAISSLAFFASAAHAVNSPEATDYVAGKLIVFNDNGAWCWYQDARVIVDTTNGKMLIGSIANKAGIGGADRNGNIELTTYDLANGKSQLFTFHKPFNYPQVSRIALVASRLDSYGGCADRGWQLMYVLAGDH